LVLHEFRKTLICNNFSSAAFQVRIRGSSDCRGYN